MDLRNLPPLSIVCLAAEVVCLLITPMILFYILLGCFLVLYLASMVMSF
jgi:hypothetical protein